MNKSHSWHSHAQWESIYFSSFYNVFPKVSFHLPGNLTGSNDLNSSELKSSFPSAFLHQKVNVD